MTEKRINIAIIESSDIVFEGLSNILLKGKPHFNLFRIDDLDDLGIVALKNNLQIVIISPAQVQNRIRSFRTQKSSFPALIWLGLVYALYDPGLLSQFDGLININNTAEEVYQLINKLIGEEWTGKSLNKHERLSDRETDVLIQLVKGLSNKEIADKLNISIHTVVSHRKSITQKVGIKSQPGLTIYAISNKIISIEALM